MFRKNTFGFEYFVQFLQMNPFANILEDILFIDADNDVNDDHYCVDHVLAQMHEKTVT